MRRLLLCLAVACAAFTPLAFASSSLSGGGDTKPNAAPVAPRQPSEPTRAFNRELQKSFVTVKEIRTALGHRVPARPRLAPEGKRREQLARWRARARSAGAALERAIPHRSQWLCIHSHEAGPQVGGWSANTGNGYYGGLQMDRAFQDAYGNGLLQRKGTADHWTPEEQMLAAERAHQVSGFAPWPNTARMCGLLR